MNGLVEDGEEVEAWIGAVHAAYGDRKEAAGVPEQETRITSTTGWTCAGSGAAHEADLERLETVRAGGNTTIAIVRCRRCSCLYRYVQFEITDWGPSGDYYDETHIWTPLAPDEVGALRADSNYVPRASTSYRYDTGWKAG